MAKGWLDLADEDVRVAHAAYFLATGKDLFGGNIARTYMLDLEFTENGLAWSQGDTGTNCTATSSYPARHWLKPDIPLASHYCLGQLKPKDWPTA